MEPRRGEHRVGVHHSAQAPGKLLPHAKERIGWACPSVIIRIITVEAKLLVAIH